MEQIKLNDIDLKSMHKLLSQGSTSTLYKDGSTCYKILDKLYVHEKEELHKKFLAMDGIKIDNVLTPKELIVKNDKLEGYTMDYFPNSMQLSDAFSVRHVDTKRLLNYISKASEILRTIHDNNIIYKDLSFENILIDAKGNVVFCDLDGCSYDKYTSPFISMLMKYFLVDYRHEKIKSIPNLDRISMLISFYYLIYAKEIQHISKRQYNKLSSKIQTLENAKAYARMLKDKDNPIGEIPYLDELIDESDDYTYDRVKHLSFTTRMLRNKK